MLSPLLQRIEGDPSLIGAQPLDLVTIRGEDAPNLSVEYNVSITLKHNPHADLVAQIRAVPTVFAFRNGTVIGQFTGALSLPQIKSWFATLK